MSGVDRPLLTVEFDSLHSRRMDGIYEVGRNALAAFPSCGPSYSVHCLTSEYLRV